MRKMKSLFMLGTLVGFTLGVYLSKTKSDSADQTLGLNDDLTYKVDEAENKIYQLSERLQELLAKLDPSALVKASSNLKSKIQSKLQELNGLLA